MYVATINVPGYLPMDDDPPTFDTAREAWAYLADERARAEDDFGNPDNDGDYSQCHDALRALANEDERTDADLCGYIQGPTPGYDGDHDLGLNYAVAEAEPSMIDVAVTYKFVVSVEPGYTTTDVAEAVRGYINSVGYALDEPVEVTDV